MDFTGKKAIYLQIADYLCDEIMTGKYREDERIPSVREVAGMVEVNSNTVMRSFEWMQNQEVIFNKRGLGYFVSKGAKDIISQIRRREFIEEVIPDITRTMQTLGISKEELLKLMGDQ